MICVCACKMEHLDWRFHPNQQREVNHEPFGYYKWSETQTEKTQRSD